MLILCLNILIPFLLTGTTVNCYNVTEYDHTVYYRLNVLIDAKRKIYPVDSLCHVINNQITNLFINNCMKINVLGVIGVEHLPSSNPGNLDLQVLKYWRNN